MTTVGDILETERRLRAYCGDIPSTGGGRGGGELSYGDRTGSLAARNLATKVRRPGDPHPDAAYRDLLDLQRIRQRITEGRDTRRDHRTADDIIHRWRPLSEEREAALRSETTGDPGCRSCARIGGPSGAPLYSPCHPGLNVCQWCHRTLARIRCFPKHINDDVVHPAVLRWHLVNPDSRLTDVQLERLIR